MYLWFVKGLFFFTKIRSVLGLYFNLIRSVWILGNPATWPNSYAIEPNSNSICPTSRPQDPTPRP